MSKIMFQVDDALWLTLFSLSLWYQITVENVSEESVGLLLCVRCLKLSFFSLFLKAIFWRAIYSVVSTHSVPVALWT